MDKKKVTEIVVTGILVIVFGIILATSLKPKPKKKKKAEATAAAAQTSSGGGGVSSGEGDQKKKGLGFISQEVIDAQLDREKEEWGRDPFFASLSGVSFRQGNLTLKGIAYSTSGPSAALINEMVVFEGDTIGNVEVIGIDKNLVVLREAERKFILRLETIVEDSDAAKK